MDYHSPLAKSAAAVAEQTTKALEWVGDPRNEELVGAARRSIEQTLRRARRRSQRLALAADANMCVSVFGPSQVGKSYLVSVLARPEGGTLVADYGAEDGELDYLQDINPAGGGESTGLVTRFTMSRSDTPSGFPVQLRLLSEADIACVIINSFFMDGNQSEPRPTIAKINQHIQDYQVAVGGPHPGLQEEEVWEIREYVQRRFGALAYAAELDGFWESAAEIAPRLTGKKRAQFLSLLWGKHDALTELYAYLSDHRRQLGEGVYAFAPLQSLTPRETSIIDVTTLKALHSESEGEPLELTVIEKGQEKRVVMPRPVICALAAEMILPMRDRPSEFFDQTDLLDFPGARNRFKRALEKFLANKPSERVPEMILRGKVAYLFDRYAMDQEITSMLLCLQDGNMEAVDLPLLVDEWVTLTHGGSPAQRAEAECILFLVLTMFDKHLVDAAGSGEPEERFENRMYSSLIEKFGAQDDSWPKQWTPGHPFKNSYWLRNPNVRDSTPFIEYDSNRREDSIRESEGSRLSQLRTGYLKSSLVQQHFENPEAAWDAAMTLNDGGARHIIENLTKVCRPEVKEQQITTQLVGIIDEIAPVIGAFHVSGDLDKRLAEKRELAAQVIGAADQVFNRGRFAALLAMLSAVEDDIAGRLRQVPSSIRISGSDSDSDGGTTMPDTKSESVGAESQVRHPDQPSGISDSDSVKGEDSGPTKRIEVMTQEQYQAHAAISCWLDRINAVLADQFFTARFGTSPKHIQVLVSETTHGMRRERLLDIMRAKLRQAKYDLSPNRQFGPEAMICAEWINRYVMSFGSLLVSEEERPKVACGEGNLRPVFSDGPVLFDADELPTDRNKYAKDRLEEWKVALLSLFEANAKEGIEDDTDIEQNERVGAVVHALEAVRGQLK